MNYVAPIYRINNVDANNMIHGFDEHTLITWEHLLMIDHAYHCDDDDYCGGLSFINRIIKKIGFRHPDWDAGELRDYIESVHPENKVDAYTEIIKDMLQLYVDIEYYGL